MGKKGDVEPKRMLELLRDPTQSPAQLAERCEASAPACDEARALVEELETAEPDAILALPSVLGRAVLRAAAAAGRMDVLQAAATEGDKELQREAKRLAFGLGRQGVEVALPQSEPAAPQPAAPVVVADPSPCFLGPVDGRGERVAIWTRSLSGRGLEVTHLWLSDRKGVVDCAIGEMSKKRFREWLESARAGDETLHELERETVRVAIDRARLVARDRAAPPAAFTSWAPQVLGPVPATPPAGLCSGLPCAASREACLERLAAPAIFDAPELRFWAPPFEAIERLAAQLTAPDAPDALLGELVAEWRRQVGDELLRERLADAAWFAGVLGAQERAEALQAAATALEAGDDALASALLHRLAVRARELLQKGAAAESHHRTSSRSVVAGR